MTVEEIKDAIVQLRDHDQIHDLEIFCQAFNKVLDRHQLIDEEYEISFKRIPPKEIQKERTWSIKFTGHDDGQKIPAIKQVRVMTGWGLKEAKEFVEGNGKSLRDFSSYEDAYKWWSDNHTGHFVCKIEENITKK